MNPVLQPKLQPQADAASKENDQLFLRLGYLAIGVIFLARLAYIASGVIQLSEDEAYQWLWSKHLALSYYSKPPLIAYTQFLGTSWWGDNAFGVRVFSPVMAALVSFLLLRFLAREINARVGLCLIIIINCTPLIAVGATLLTVDPLLVLFWTAAMIAGWRAVQPNSTTRPWLWVGLWMGLGFLSKYNAAFQILCWGLFFALWPPARAQLKRPGPYLALLITLLCTVPVIIWNAQHDWITVEHVSSHARLGEPWKPTLRFFWDFLFSESMLLNPVFFIAAIWATFAFWKRDRRNPLFLFFFCMGSPIFLGHWLYSLHSRILPNWIAPAILPMLCLMVVYWHRRWQEGARVVRIGLKTGIALGLVVVVLLHDTNLIGKIVGRTLPADKDPLHRVRTWSEIARVAGEARTKLLAEGKPVFIIAAHYGLVGQISFYLPEAKASVKQTPMVYYQTTTHPQNQFYFWPGYRETRHGDNAIYVQELDASPLPGDWFKNWITGRTDLLVQTVPPSPPPSEELRKEFDSVSDLGVFEIKYRGRTFRYLHILACRNLH